MSDIELYLLRHAHAGNPAAWSGDDAARPLSDKGTGQAERLGKLLAKLKFKPDAIISSPKLRARQTAEIVAGALDVGIEIDDHLAGPLDLGDIDGLLRATGGRVVVLVGHDPDFSELAAELSGGPTLELKKGALARFDVSLPLEPGAAAIRWLLPPDAVG